MVLSQVVTSDQVDSVAPGVGTLDNISTRIVVIAVIVVMVVSPSNGIVAATVWPSNIQSLTNNYQTNMEGNFGEET